MKKASAVTLLILIGILTCCLGAFGCSALIGLSSVIGWFLLCCYLPGISPGLHTLSGFLKRAAGLANREH